ncbi:MAG: S41 family peptidase, partial [Planctomycetota bacterium]
EAPDAVPASDVPSEAQVENLWTLGKVWGFLKYHHPSITQGDIDWDGELLARIPEVLSAGERAGGLAAAAGWIDSLPALPDPSGVELDTGRTHLVPDLDWIHDDELLGEGLSAFLEKVHAARSSAGDQRYAKVGPGAGNPLFDGDEAFADLMEPDASHRLLGLFRFWNIIQWWSPYRDLLDDDWDEVLARFIPRVLAAVNRDVYALEMVALAALVKDTHTSVWPTYELVPPTGSLTLPVSLRFVQGKAVVWRVLEGADENVELMQGDALLEIDGRPVAEIVEEVAPLYPASNQPTRLSRIARRLGRSDVQEATLLVERAGEEIELRVERMKRDGKAEAKARPHERPGPAFERLSEDVAFVKLSTAKVADVLTYIEEAKGTKGLVVDIRNYPDEFMILYTLAGHLVTEPTPFAEFTRPDYANPGATLWGDKATLMPREPHYPGKVVVLVDESSISRAEFTAMAFQSVPGAVVLGSTTAGADGNVSPIKLPGGISSLLSGLGVFYPDRSPTQRVGVRIDVPCEPTMAGIREERDELLEEAVRRITGG